MMKSNLCREESFSWARNIIQSKRDERRGDWKVDDGWRIVGRRLRWNNSGLKVGSIIARAFAFGLVS